MAIRLYNGVMPMVLSTTGSRIRALRERPELDMSQDELARRLVVSNAFLSEIERDKKKPPLGMVVRLARLLGTTTDYLLLLTDAPELPTVNALPESAATFSEEAELIAQYVDAAPEFRRQIMLAVVQAIANTAPVAIEYGAGRTAESVAASLRAAGLVVGDDTVQAIRAEILRFLLGVTAPAGSAAHNPTVKAAPRGEGGGGGDALGEQVTGHNGGNRRG